MLARTIHSWRKRLKPYGNPLPSAKLVSKLLDKEKLPRLQGQEVIFITDSTTKHGYTYDGIVCIDRPSLMRWNLARMQVRKRFPDIKEFHYKKIKPGRLAWNGVLPFLETMFELNGLALVVATPESWTTLDSTYVVDAKRTGLSRTAHPWPHVDGYNRVINLTSMLAGIGRSIIRRKMDVHWVSDTEPPFRNEMQRRDIYNGFIHALDLSVPYSLGVKTLTIKKELPKKDYFRDDLIALPDMIAGGIGDALRTIGPKGLAWDPEVMNDQYRREGVVANWYWLEQAPSLAKAVITFQEVGVKDGVDHRSATMLKYDQQQRTTSSSVAGRSRA